MHLFGEPPVMFCRRCHRQLNDPRSRERGLGPTCAKKDSGLGNGDSREGNE